MNQLQRGVREEIDDISDEETMADEEDGENFQNTELELLDGDREGTKWLVINGVHICYMRKDKGTKKTTAWECSGRRRLGCEFKIRTTNSEGPVLSQSSQ